MMEEMLQPYRGFCSILLNIFLSGLKIAPILFILSCGGLPSKLKTYKQSNINYWENQISFFGKTFESQNKTIKLPIAFSKYLNNLTKKIRIKSKLDLSREIQVKVLKSQNPFWYSLPTGEIIFSSDFIKKYVFSESFLASVISFELVRINTLAYEKNKLYPKGYIDQKEFLKLFYLDSKRRITIHKWAMINIHRSNFDIHEYLNWIQTISRHLDKFSTMGFNLTELSLEERDIKRFLTANDEISLFKIEDTKKSSTIFYDFKNFISGK